MARPPCWYVHGVRRAMWVPDNEYNPRDIFGFKIREGMLIFVNAFSHGDLRAAHVDYPHGLHLQERTVVQVVEEDGEKEDYRLQDVITVRALRHFVSLWRRFIRLRRMRRRREVWL